MGQDQHNHLGQFNRQGTSPVQHQARQDQFSSNLHLQQQMNKILLANIQQNQMGGANVQSFNSPNAPQLGFGQPPLFIHSDGTGNFNSLVGSQ